MPRIARKCIDACHFLHIMVQGNNREFIFNSELQKEKYQKLVINYARRYHIEIVAFCIMGNHVHLLIYKTQNSDVSEFMKRVNMNYAMWYNNENQRKGYVYRDRYKVQVIYDRKHFIDCIVYIHNNPVNAGLCKEAKDYPFSSFKEFYGTKKKEWLQDYFGTYEQYEIRHKRNQKRTYIEDVEEDIKSAIKIKIDEFMAENNLDRFALIKNRKQLGELSKRLKEEFHISNEILKEELEISSEKIRKIMLGE